MAHAEHDTPNSTDAAAAAAGDKAVDVVLAEFTALRAEIVSRSTVQATLVGVGLTALTAIVGLTVQKGGDVRLLLTLGPLAMLVNMLWSIENRRVTLIGQHIGDVTWPQLLRLARVPTKTVHKQEIIWWQQAVLRRRSDPKHTRFTLAADGALLTAFVVAGIVGLVVAWDVASWPLRAGEGLVLAVAAGAPITYARAVRDAAVGRLSS